MNFYSPEPVGLPERVRGLPCWLVGWLALPRQACDFPERPKPKPKKFLPSFIKRLKLAGHADSGPCATAQGTPSRQQKRKRLGACPVRPLPEPDLQTFNLPPSRSHPMIWQQLPALFGKTFTPAGIAA